ncbi:helix-turn-helix transcriptional regulator [Lactococcus garvieae]|nr:helix-turn-helix transcriptional regulator [Lactococcus garvieae]CEF50353.1 hypothetical protein LGMT14_00200 [Lactococcus garvieae]
MAKKNRIRELREKKGLSLQDLADKTNIKKSTLASYETRGVNPKYEKLATLAKFFDVPKVYLLGNEMPTWNPSEPEVVDSLKLSDFLDEELTSTTETSAHIEGFRTYDEKTDSSYKKETHLPLPPSKIEHEKLSIYGVPVLTDSITSFINHRDFILEKLGESIDSLKLNSENGREIWEEKYKNNLSELEFIDFQEKIKNRKFKDYDVKTQEKILTMLVKKIKMEKDEITFYWNF